MRPDTGEGTPVQPEAAGPLISIIVLQFVPRQASAWRGFFI